MDTQERSTHLAALRATSGRLKAALSGVPRALQVWAPAPGKWSILEIACHMRDMERDAYIARFRRILAEDNPTLPDVDGDLYSLEGDYRAQRLSEVLRDWKSQRRETLRILGGLREPQWKLAGTHETAGSLTMEDLLRRLAVGNDEAHLGQIEAIKRRFAILARLEAAPRALAEAVRGASDEQLRRRPEPGRWSMLENVCHLRDIERLYAERFSKMAFSERPRLWMMDNARVSERLRYNETDPAAASKDFRRRREDTLVLLRALPHSAWQRTGVHPKRGELTIEQLAEVAAEHTERHIGRIGELAGRA